MGQKQHDIWELSKCERSTQHTGKWLIGSQLSCQVWCVPFPPPLLLYCIFVRDTVIYIFTNFGELFLNTCFMQVDPYCLECLIYHWHLRRLEFSSARGKTNCALNWLISMLSWFNMFILFLTACSHRVSYTCFMLMLHVSACINTIFRWFTYSTLITCHVLTCDLLLCALHLSWV